MLRNALLILPLLAAIICACSKPNAEPSAPLASTIPAQARMVARSDLDGLLKMADCRSQGGAITLTPELRSLLSSWPGLPLIEAAAADGARLDLAETYWIDLGEGFEPVLTAKLRHPAGDYEDMATDSMPSGVAWLCDGRQAWLSLSSAAELAATVDSILTRAGKDNLQYGQSIEHEHFAQPSALLAMAKGETLANPLGDAFDAVFVSVDVDDRSISAIARFANAGAWVDATNMMQPIDAQAALADLPPGCVFVAAAGATVNSICSLIAAIPGLRFDRRFTLSIYARMLSVNGTASLAVAPGGRAETIRDFSPRHWAARLNIPISGDPVKALDFADRYLPDLYVEADSQGLYATTYEPGLYDLGADFLPDISPASRLALSARIPYQSETMKALRLRSGYAIDIQADSALRVDLRLLGPANYLLPTLIADLPK